MVAYDVTGATIEAMLEQQFVGNDRILQVSSNFTYEWSAGAADGNRVDPTKIMINGAPLNLAATYRITTNIFLSGGGDNFPMLATGTNKLVGSIDLDALVAYFEAHSPISPPALGRIVQVP
jgi:5'-nucleotidase